MFPFEEGFEGNSTSNASLFAPFYFGMFGPRDERVVSTINAVKELLWVKTEYYKEAAIRRCPMPVYRVKGV